MNESAAPKVNIAGTGISDVTLPETMALFDQWIETRTRKRICITPVNCVVWAADNAQLQQVYNEADLTLCDGVPLIWASHFLGKRSLRGRVTGLDLLPQYIARCAEKKHTMFFLGASEGVGELLKQKCEMLYPGIEIVGVYSPPFAEVFTKEENDKIIETVNLADPDILWISLTAPKQDNWLYEHRDRLKVPVAVGVGGAFEVMAGKITRAPLFMQKNGLEWLYRLYKEPRRLFRRYLVEAPAFIPLVFLQKLRNSGPK